MQDYFAEHRDRYQQPPLYTFTQVFIDPDKRGDATLDDAEEIKARLIAQGEAIEDAGALGDDFMLQSYYPAKDPIEIQKIFGSGFTEPLMQLAKGQWHGPVLSGYGVHLVYLSSVTEPPAPIFAEVRDRVAEDWRTDKSEELSEQYNAAAYRQLGTLLVQQNKLEEAAFTYRALVRKQPSATAHRELAEVLSRLGRTDEAREQLVMAESFGQKL